MKTIIRLSTTLGQDIRTRMFFRRDIEKLITPLAMNAVLDFSDVEFISRSVADEICNLLEDYPSLEVANMAGDTARMFRIVSQGRKQPREYSDLKAKIYHLKNMKELSDFFCSL